MVKINDALSQKITGEWGTDPSGDNDVKVLGTRCFNNDGRISYDLYSLRSISPKKIGAKRLLNGDIILEKSGGSDNQPVGRVVYFQGTDEDLYLCNNFTQVLRPEVNIFPLYLFFSLYYLHLKGKTQQCQNKTTGIRNLDVKAYLSIKIPLPPLEEQKLIAAMLDKAQSLIDLRKKQIAEMNELVKAKFIEMFGDLKDLNLITLEKGANLIDYRGKTPPLSEKGIRIINAKSVGKGYFKYIDEYISEETYNSWMKRGFPKHGDVLFVTEGHTFGNVCRIPNDLTKFAMGQRVITLQGRQNILNNIFLMFYMESLDFKNKINKYKTGSSAQGIRSKELKKVLIPIPSFQLQNKFADFVQQVDKSILAKHKALEVMETLYNALMQQAFS
jgi:type I restriction enzyme S subunit